TLKGVQARGESLTYPFPMHPARGIIRVGTVPKHSRHPQREGATPMSFKMQRVHIFHSEVEDKPGGISGKLKKLAEAGAHLQYIYSQRSMSKDGFGDLYVAPPHGTNELSAAKMSGMHEVSEPIVMRVEGDDRAGLS